MALQIEWGSFEADQLVRDQMARFMRAGIVATYAAYFQELQKQSAETYGRTPSYANALRAEMPLLGTVYDKSSTKSEIVPPGQSHTLTLAKVDPASGVRLDQTLLSVAYVAPGMSPGPWRVNQLLSETGFQEPQVKLILAQAVELSSHGLEVR